MISSKFSRSIAPLAFVTMLSGGMLVKSALDSKESDSEIKKEQMQDKSTNPLEDPKYLGTMFTLGLLGTAGAATLAKAIDVRYKDAKEQIDNCYDVATLSDEDYKEALEDEIKKLEAEGVSYNREELEKQFSPKTTQEIREFISEQKTKLTRVTHACNQDKTAARQLQYLTEELKSAVSYGYDIKDDDIKHRIRYQFDKATLPAKKWKKAEENYKKEFPNIDFEKQNGVKIKSFTKHAVESAIVEELGANLLLSLTKDELTEKLAEIQNCIYMEPEILNQYDRKKCNELIDEAYRELDTKGSVSPHILNMITSIYVGGQQTY